MFKQIRFKLTLWYILITMLFTIVFSYVIYIRSGGVILHALQEKQITIQRMEFPRSNKTVPITGKEIDAALQQLRFSLLVIDFFVLCMAGGAGYFLAGRTLKPVEKIWKNRNDL